MQRVQHIFRVIMKNLVKLLMVTSVFGLGVVAMFLSGTGHSRIDTVALAQVAAKPTPPANTNTNAAPAANTTPTKPPVAAAGDKTIPKSFVLGKESLSDQYGEAPFDHDSHAFKNYSPDGKSVMGCVECHHTDQPKSAMKPPYVTTERDVAMTLETWKASPQKVTDCKACHFQDGNVPEGKTMPATTKDLTNQLAYHINCNTCHDAAFKLRPELKSKPGFATSKDCSTCHKKI